MIVSEAKNTEGAVNILTMARNHPAPEYDCSFSEFSRIFSRLYFEEGFRSWIAYQDYEPVGYVCGIRNRGLKNEIVVFDIYLKPEFRGKGNITKLTDKLKEWAIGAGALRVVWTSKHHSRAWARVLGLKVSESANMAWEKENHG